MYEKKKREPDDKEQSGRFVETARKVEADEEGTAFLPAFQIVAPTKKVRSDEQKQKK